MKHTFVLTLAECAKHIWVQIIIRDRLSRMKILLIAINAKYIHSNLAVYSLRASAGPYAPSIDGRSGGFLRCGKFPAGLSADSVPGITWRKNAVRYNTISGANVVDCMQDDTAQKTLISGTLPEPPSDTLDELPFVYQRPEDFAHRIIYYESSRGCPFFCSYCLSSIERHVRFRSMELVEKELTVFLEHKVPQVKFVDRTFNCNYARTVRLWKFLLEHDNGVTNFHFEIAADLLNEEELELLSRMRPGLVQLEIGVQTVNVQALQAIHRIAEFAEIAKRVDRISQCGNVHQHLDLIAGLPYEDFESFQHSFDEVYRLHPQELQLGFLKV